MKRLELAVTTYLVWCAAAWAAYHGWWFLSLGRDAYWKQGFPVPVALLLLATLPLSMGILVLVLHHVLAPPFEHRSFVRRYGPSLALLMSLTVPWSFIWANGNYPILWNLYPLSNALRLHTFMVPMLFPRPSLRREEWDEWLARYCERSKDQEGPWRDQTVQVSGVSYHVCWFRPDTLPGRGCTWTLEPMGSGRGEQDPLQNPTYVVLDDGTCWMNRSCGVSAIARRTPTVVSDPGLLLLRDFDQRKPGWEPYGRIRRDLEPWRLERTP